MFDLDLFVVLILNESRKKEKSLDGLVLSAATVCVITTDCRMSRREFP
jgi:hypothetical protein